MLGGHNSFFVGGGGGIKEDGGEEEGQSVCPIKVPMIHLVLVEGRHWDGRRK